MPNIYVNTQISFHLSVNCPDTRSHTGPTALPGPLKWSVKHKNVATFLCNIEVWLYHRYTSRCSRNPTSLISCSDDILTIGGSALVSILYKTLETKTTLLQDFISFINTMSSST